MSKLTERKAKAEIRSININLIINGLKFILLIIGSVLVFWIIQKPESVLNRRLSAETINQNRSKLILDLFEKNKEPSELLLGLTIIKRSYPKTESKWIDQIERLIVTKLRFTRIEDVKNIRTKLRTTMK